MKLLVFGIFGLIFLSGCVSINAFGDGIKMLEAIDSRNGISGGNIAPSSLVQANSYKNELIEFKQETESNPLNFDKDAIIALIDLRLSLNEMQKNNLTAINLIDNSVGSIDCMTISSLNRVKSNAVNAENKVNEFKENFSDKSSGLSDFFSNIIQTTNIIKEESNNLKQLIEPYC